MTDRGVSEVLGFVLVFALVTGTIGVVYATGITGLHDAQYGERVDNVERAFDVLADNLEDLHRTGAPSRATEVKLPGGFLGTTEPVQIEVYVEEKGNTTNNNTFTVNPRPIVYRDDGGTEFLYTSGAVIRSNDHGAVMVSEPSWVVRSNRAAVPLVRTHSDGDGIAGEGTVLLVAQVRSRTLQEPFDAGSTARVNVTVTSPRSDVWKQFFESEGMSIVDESDDSVSGEFETESLYVSQTRVDVSINR